MSIINTYLDYIPGEEFLTKSLQYELLFQLDKKTIKKGRLLIFKRVHYHILITLLTPKNEQEKFEIPIPLHVEDYPEEKLIYFDYRLHNLTNNDITKKKLNTNANYLQPSQFFNKILEIQTLT